MRIYLAGPIFFYGDYLRNIEWATKIREKFPNVYLYSPRLMSWRKICKLVFVTVLFGAAFAVAAETADSSVVKKDSVAVADSTGLKTSREGVFSIAALLLPHNSLRNSETLHNWPFFAFAVPAYTYHFKVQQDFGKLLSFKGLASGDVNFAGIGVKLDAAIDNIADNYVSGITVNGSGVTVSDNVAALTLTSAPSTGAAETPIIVETSNNGGITLKFDGLDCGFYA